MDFVGKVMSLLYNMLSSLLITFLPRSSESESKVTQSCPTLCDPMDCSLPGSSLHGILQARVLEWVAISFSRGSSQPRDRSQVSCIPGVSIFYFHGCNHHLQWFWSQKKIKSDTVSTVSPSISHKVMGADAMIFVFWMLSFKTTFSLSSFTFVKRLFSSSLLSAIRVVSSAYLRLLIFLLAILIPAYASSSPAFLMMYSAYKLNKQGDNIQPRHTPFPIWNQSVVPC